jgi:hypothetical protein
VRRARVVEADVLCSDALEPELGDGFELWVGNPPYNGTSPILRDKAAWARACAWLPPAFALPRYTSLREDYVFFLLRASRRLAQREGALAFITSSTLLDAFNYAPVRRALLESLELREVVDLGAGAFSGTRVRTCITVWTAARGGRGARFSSGDARPGAEGALQGTPLGGWGAARASPPVELTPRGPSWALRPADLGVEALEARWREGGATLTELVPVSFPGLKTRFDELLVDDDPGRLLARVEAFVGAEDLEGFARAFGLDARLLPKLEALKRSCGGLQLRADAVRPFLRYRGARPRGAPGGW